MLYLFYIVEENHYNIRRGAPHRILMQQRPKRGKGRYDGKVEPVGPIHHVNTFACVEEEGAAATLLSN